MTTVDPSAFDAPTTAQAFAQDAFDAPTAVANPADNAPPHIEERAMPALDVPQRDPMAHAPMRVHVDSRAPAMGLPGPDLALVVCSSVITIVAIGSAASMFLSL